MISFERELLYEVNNLFLLIARQGTVEWQPDKLIADAFCHRAVSWFSTKLTSHLREMQGEIMKDANYAAFV
jgi:hypothetical protein